MKKILFTIIILLCSCSPKLAINQNNINFTKEMSFNEFKIMLEEYAKINSYPNINN
jgi:hypothetical protein